MPRRLYILFAACVAVVAVSFFVAETFVPDVDLGSASASRPAADTTQSVTASSPASASGGIPAWVVVGSLGVATLSLVVAGGSLWGALEAERGPADASNHDGVRAAQVDAVVNLTRVLVPCLHAATQYVQIAQMLAQLGDEAPATLSDRVEDARASVEAQHRDVHAAVTQGAVFLPNAVLDAVHDVDRVLRTMLSDDVQVRQQGTQLAAQAMTAYYTFAATARHWAGVGELKVERLLGLSPTPNPSSVPNDPSAASPDAPDEDDDLTAP